MKLSGRFLNLVNQLLASFDGEALIAHLVVYVANSAKGDSPTLDAIGEWPHLGKALPTVESDPELRTPSPLRRWYPLQEESILLGVLRVETISSLKSWPESLDHRLNSTASVLGKSLASELDRQRLINELSEQREQISLMVHQLRNPLAALRTYAQLLLRKLGPESKDINLVEGLLSEQAQLTQYISALDQLSQDKLPSNDLNPPPLLLPPVLANNPSFKNIRNLLEPLIDRASAMANLSGRKWFAPSIWPDWTSQNSTEKDGIIAEIVANLLENAFRYSSNNSAIGLFLNNQGLCVWDSGQEIDKDDKEKIFNKGFRGKNSQSTFGTGLGLAVGRELAQDLGGTLILEIPPSEFDKALPASGNAFVLSLSNHD